jgi:2-iminobutanoate/2-iminopropanoate deaminase
MNTIHNPDTVHEPAGAYSHGMEVPPNARWLFVSGQVGVSLYGEVAEGFNAQCEQAWANLFSVLESGGMTKEDLVKLTIFMVRPEDMPVLREVRDRFIERPPATTLVFVKALVGPEWLIEIEGIAARA